MNTNHVHDATMIVRGDPQPTYHFCLCGFIRIVWLSGKVLEWHQPSMEMAREARRIDDAEFKCGGLFVKTESGMVPFKDLSPAQRMNIAYCLDELASARWNPPSLRVGEL